MYKNTIKNYLLLFGITNNHHYELNDDTVSCICFQNYDEANEVMNVSLLKGFSNSTLMNDWGI